MTNMKKVLTIGTLVALLGVSSLTAFAASNYNTPAEAVAGLTGKTVESVVAEKLESDKTYGTIAEEAGKLEEFKSEILEIKKATLAEKVAAGNMTQEQADEIISALEESIENCDGTGTGSTRIGQKMNAGFGGMNGKGNGNGLGRGQGGQGLGLGRK